MNFKQILWSVSMIGLLGLGACGNQNSSVSVSDKENTPQENPALQPQNSPSPLVEEKSPSSDAEKGKDTGPYAIADENKEIKVEYKAPQDSPTLTATVNGMIEAQAPSYPTSDSSPTVGVVVKTELQERLPEKPKSVDCPDCEIKTDSVIHL